MMTMMMVMVITMGIPGARRRTDSKYLNVRGYTTGQQALGTRPTRDLEARGDTTCQQALGTRLTR
eukprot:7693359-Pyramimonas_sp.AAC.1